MRETIKNLKSVYKFGKDYKLYLIIEVLCSIFSIIINVIMPLVSAQIIVNFTNHVWEQALYMALVLLVINVLNEIKILISRKCIQIFRRGSVRNIQMSLGREILKLEQSELDSKSSGVFIQRLTNDTDKMSDIFTFGMGILSSFLSKIGSFIAILIIDYHMFIYYLMAAIILTILHYIKNKKIKIKELEYRKQSDKVAGLTSELVRGAKDIKMLFAKDSFLSELDKNTLVQSEKNFEMRNIDTKYNLGINSLRDVFEYMTIVILVFLVQKNYISLALALALHNYKYIVLGDFMVTVSMLLDECKNFNISCNRVFDIINNKKFKKEKFGKEHIAKIKGDFEFKNVNFGYNDSLILDNFDLKIKNGTTVGLVGKSGAGKTTIFNLLCKLYSINSGNLLIDGKDINNLDEESIRGNITIISQNPYIFNMSIKDNLKLVKNNLTDKEIKEACKISCLDDYIESLPDKYDTIVGEGGVNLSGGERQRLAIARALIQNTKIILFDEATSALDNETQAKIQKAIDNLKGDYTIIIIAHRLSTIVNCDKILILENGKIIDSGKHKELLKNNKSYKKLCETELIQK